MERFYLSIHLLTDAWVASSLAIVDTTVNIGAPASFWFSMFNSFGCILRRNCSIMVFLMFSFEDLPHTVFHSNCPSYILLAMQQGSHFHILIQRLLFSGFLMMAILLGINGISSSTHQVLRLVKKLEMGADWQESKDYSRRKTEIKGKQGITGVPSSEHTERYKTSSGLFQIIY